MSPENAHAPLYYAPGVKVNLKSRPEKQSNQGVDTKFSIIFPGVAV